MLTKENGCSKDVRTTPLECDDPGLCCLTDATSVSYLTTTSDEL